MRTMYSREIFTKECRQQQIFDSDLKEAWHYNHVTFTPIAKNFMLYCRLIYTLSILCVRLTIKVKVGIPESFKVGRYPPPPPPKRKTKKTKQKQKLGRVTLITAKYIWHFARNSVKKPSLGFYLFSENWGGILSFEAFVVASWNFVRHVRSYFLAIFLLKSICK